MLEFINKSLNNYENEETITKLLNSLGLPTSLESIMSMSNQHL